MQFGTKTFPPRRVVAAYWAFSMFVAWAGGTLLIGFDLGTTVIWLAFTILAPVLVIAFVIAFVAAADPPRRTAPRVVSRPNTSRYSTLGE